MARPTGTASPSSISDDALSAPAAVASSERVSWRRNLAVIWAVQVFAIVGFSLRSPFLPFYLGDLGVDTVEGQTLWAGLINAAGGGVMAVTAPFWGILADRRGRRIMLIRAAAGGCLTVALMAFVTAPWQLLGLRLVEGALTGTVAAATVLVATGTPKERLGYALGLLQTAIFAGSSFGPLVGGVLADRIGFRPTFLVASTLLGLAALLTVVAVRERFEPPAAGPVDPTIGRWRRFWAATAPLLTGALVTLVAALFVIRFAAMAVQPIVPLFVAELAPGTADAASLAGIVLGVLGATSALSAVFLGRLSDRRGHRGVLLACTAAAGLLYLPMALARGPWELAAVQALFGVAAGGMIPAANALIAHLTPPDRRATMYGLTQSSGALGAFAGPLVGAGLAVALGFRATFVATGLLLLLLAALVAVGIPRRLPLDEA